VRETLIGAGVLGAAVTFAFLYLPVSAGHALTPALARRPGRRTDLTDPTAPTEKGSRD